MNAVIQIEFTSMKAKVENWDNWNQVWVGGIWIDSPYCFMYTSGYLAAADILEYVTLQ